MHLRLLIDSPLDSTSEPSAAPSFKCGYIALVGRPNAGKSTLFNTFIGQRLSIVTPKPQTTRNRILGILTRPHSQFIFLDTPGLLEPSYKLHHTMAHQIALSARQADLVVLLIDATSPRDRSELVKTFLQQAQTPVLAALNKVDLLPNKRLQPLRESLEREYNLAALRPISALEGEGTEDLLQAMESLLPVGDQLYPDDMIAEQPERFFAAEFIREAAFEQLEQELPYAINVSIEEFAERQDKTYIQAWIFVEQNSQKGIVIGSKGKRLRAIGQRARLQLEEFLGASVYLDLWVKVRPDWRNRDRSLKEFGYQ
ncbi:MAG: GTPase Era [Candidatus Latescibacteria bacterium]|nr:GTPase Era [Candidatus Latescibacterota bacterium]